MNLKLIRVFSATSIVTTESERHVTVHRSADATATLSCDPRCTTVPNPDVLEQRAAASASGSGGAEQAATGGGDGGQALAAGVSGATAATASGVGKIAK